MVKGENRNRKGAKDVKNGLEQGWERGTEEINNG